MANERVELVQGTLDLLILRILELMPLHGVAIADRIEQVTSGVFQVRAESLCASLHRQGPWLRAQKACCE